MSFVKTFLCHFLLTHSKNNQLITCTQTLYLHYPRCQSAFAYRAAHWTYSSTFCLKTDSSGFTCRKYRQALGSVIAALCISLTHTPGVCCHRARVSWCEVLSCPLWRIKYFLSSLSDWDMFICVSEKYICQNQWENKISREDYNNNTIIIHFICHVIIIS